MTTPPVAGAEDPLPTGHSGPSTLSVVLGTLLVIAALRVGRAFVMPIVISVLLTLMLTAPARWLELKRVPEKIAAAIVVFGTVALLLILAAALVGPTMDWVASAPQTMAKLETKVRRLAQPLLALEKSADRVQRATDPVAADAPSQVEVVAPGIFAKVSEKAITAVPVALTVVFLTYFLLASGPLFRRKLASLLPGKPELSRREHLLAVIELATSHFLITVVAVNTSVGILTALLLWAVGVPSPLLWGMVAAVLNFVPYLGPIITTIIIGLAALASMDSPARALLAPAAFFAIHLVETNFIAPRLLGRHLPVNVVAVFLGLLLFGWMWGIPGAVLALPLTVCVKLICDHVPSLAHVGELLGP